MGEIIKVQAPILRNEIFEEDEQLDCDFINEILEQQDDMDDEAKTEEIIKAAEKNAKKIIDDAFVKIEEEREIILEQAQKNGYEEGYNHAMNQCDELIREAAQLKERALKEYKEYLGGIENEVVSIILDISKKVVGAHIAFNPEDIISVVRDALESCANKDHILMKVSEEDFDYVLESKSKILSMIQGIGELEIKMDHSLDAGSCLLETPYGAIDGGVNTRLDEIEKVFKGLVGR
jgi:flagellar assembly protein FliH